MSPTLTGKQRRHLRALAHPLKPVVQIGTSGLTPALLQELGRALESHELVKVRVGKECPLEIEELVSPLEAGVRAQVAQVIGRTLVVYRRRAKDPKIELPSATGGK